MADRKRARKQKEPVTEAPQGPQPPQIKVPAAFKSHHETMAGLKYSATKFYGPRFAEYLGVDDQIRFLAYNFGWENFLGQNALTYQSLAQEFLATLQMYCTSPEDQDFLEFDIAFRFFNTPYRLTLAELNCIFGFNPDNNIFDLLNYTPDGFAEHVFWREISGLPRFDGRYSIASQIHHPVMRIFHRMIGYALF